VLATVVADDQIDAVIVNMGLGVKGRVKGLRRVYEPLFAQSHKPLLFHSHIIPCEENLEELADFGAHGFPSFRACAFALHALSVYGRFQQQWQATRANAQARREPPSMPRFDAGEKAGGVLGEVATRAVLERFGVPTPPSRLAGSSAAALAAARALGFPVVLKIQSPGISHKTEAGGVELNIAEEGVEPAYARIMANALRHAPDAPVEGVLVQKQMPAGQEVVIGIVTDPDFGPLIMLGLGGIYVEILKDVAFAPPPIDRDEALRMIGSLKASPILFGARGRPAADVDALADLLLRVSDMALAGRDTIDQLDLNPIFVYPKGQGVVAVDALIAVNQA
jgi:acetyltransferase